MRIQPILSTLLVFSLVFHMPLHSSSTLEDHHTTEIQPEKNKSTMDKNRYKTMEGLKITDAYSDFKKSSYRENMAIMASWGISFVLFSMALSIFTKTSDVSQTVNPTKPKNGGKSPPPTPQNPGSPASGAGGVIPGL